MPSHDMDQYRNPESTDRVQLSMQLLPKLDHAINGKPLPAPWTLFIEMSMNRAHLAEIMESGLFWHHPTRHTFATGNETKIGDSDMGRAFSVMGIFRSVVLHSDWDPATARAWSIRETIDNGTSTPRWYGQIHLFTSGPDHLESFPGLDVLDRSMTQNVSIRTFKGSEFFRFDRRSENNPAQKTNYNNFNDNEPAECLSWIWPGDRSDDTTTLVTTVNNEKAVVGSCPCSEYHRRHGDGDWGESAQPRVAVEVVHVQSSFWENIIKLAALDSMRTFLFFLGAGVFVVLVAFAITGCTLATRWVDSMSRR
ncbi:hypothetical protein V8F33_005807 [Rhypophila sp. PSN 637]